MKDPFPWLRPDDDLAYYDAIDTPLKTSGKEKRIRINCLKKLLRANERKKKLLIIQ